jgi:hypothetical protein
VTRRERVNSPEELRAGDRVEVDTPVGVFLFDLFWWGPCPLFPESVWHGYNLNPPPGCSPFPRVMAPICFTEGRVYIRRRAREDHPVARTRVVYCSVADLKAIVGPGARSRE